MTDCLFAVGVVLSSEIFTVIPSLLLSSDELSSITSVRLALADELAREEEPGDEVEAFSECLEEGVVSLELEQSKFGDIARVEDSAIISFAIASILSVAVFSSQLEETFVFRAAQILIASSSLIDPI